jgi:uncharacterized protein
MESIYGKLLNCSGFEWDKNNIDKNWQKHHVTPMESEQIFFNNPLFIFSDIRHSESETRYYALGKTDRGRRLFTVFTIRNDEIRVISVRDMSRKEKETYENHK